MLWTYHLKFEIFSQFGHSVYQKGFNHVVKSTPFIALWIAVLDKWNHVHSKMADTAFIHILHSLFTRVHSLYISHNVLFSVLHKCSISALFCWETAALAVSCSVLILLIFFHSFVFLALSAVFAMYFQGLLVLTKFPVFLTIFHTGLVSLFVSLVTYFVYFAAFTHHLVALTHIIAAVPTHAVTVPIAIATAKTTTSSKISQIKSHAIFAFSSLRLNRQYHFISLYISAFFHIIHHHSSHNADINHHLTICHRFQYFISILLISIAFW